MSAYANFVGAGAYCTRAPAPRAPAASPNEGVTALTSAPMPGRG